MAQSSRSPGSPPADTFLVLPENRFAYTAVAALSTAATTEARRPIFLHGPSGVGKSHLARHAVRLLLRQNESFRLEHLVASEFAARFADASDKKSIAAFRAPYQNLDLFVLEDLQNLENRLETQRQLLAICDDLAAHGCQILWTSSKSAGELQNFLPRLVNRFRAGVTALITLPATASRVDLLQHFAKTRQIPLPPEVARLLAEKLAVSPRELLATLQQVEAQARLKKKPLDRDFAEKFLSNDVPPAGINLTAIARAVAQHFSITVTALRSRARLQGLVLPRQCGMLLSRELTGKGLEQIGKFYGHRDHSTVVHACQRLRTLLQTEPDIQSHLTNIRNTLGASEPAGGNDLMSK